MKIPYLYSVLRQLLHASTVRQLEIVEISQINSKILVNGSHIGM